MVNVAVSLAEIHLLTENWDSYKLIFLHHILLSCELNKYIWQTKCSYN